VSLALSGGIVMLFLLGAIAWNRHPQFNQSYRTFTQKLTTELLSLLPDVDH
jgi:hypothetical protein